MITRSKIVHEVYLSDGRVEKIIDPQAIQMQLDNLCGAVDRWQQDGSDMNHKMIGIQAMIADMQKHIENQTKMFKWIGEAYPEVIQGYKAIKDLENSLNAS